ncbi:MAG: nuclear transport factor 2 family protein [Terracidiphilus sp.]
MKPASRVALLFYLLACFSGSLRAQNQDKKDEIPIERCDLLPVVTIKVARENRRFLLDTAATTILNLKSFAGGESREKIDIYSWSGKGATSAREVSLPQVELGTHKLRDLKLPAIDLSPIGKACGGQIDGILGMDLLDRMGMTIDLNRRVAVPAPAGEPGDSTDALAEAERDLGSCNVAFNHGDVIAMEECFDPEIVFYTQHGEYRGREEVMRYLSQRFFKDAPRLHYDATPHDVRILGDVLWYSYDFWIDTPEEHLAGHGMTMCRKDAGGRWRMLGVHNSVTEAAAAPGRAH